MINIGIVGFGYWGSRLARVFSESEGSHVVAVCDQQESHLEKAKRVYPHASVSSDFRSVLEHESVQALVIATPAPLHFEMALAALRAGKHVLVARPLSLSVVQGEQLVLAAEKNRRILMVDHVFVYSGAVQVIRDLLINKSLGQLYYYDAVRVNPGYYDHQVNVVWALALHDMAIMNYVLPYKPVAVSATAISHIRGQPEDLAYVTLHYAEGFLGHIHANWFAPTKIRRSLIGGNHRMIVYDHLDPAEPVKVYDRGISVANQGPGKDDMLSWHRMGDMWSPRVSAAEPLGVEVEHFNSCVENNTEPITSGHFGLEVVRWAEAAGKSMKSGGAVVNL